MTLTHQDIAAAHYRACQRRNVKPPKKLLRLYPHLKPKRPRAAPRPRLPRETVIAIWVAAHRGDTSQAAIARQYGVTDKLVSQIKTGSHYAKVTMSLMGGGT